MVIKQLIGRKIGMTNFITDNGVCAATVIEILPNVIVQIKKNSSNEEFDHYVIGYGVKKKNINNCEKGFAKKNNIAPAMFYKDILLDKSLNLSIGNKINASLFKEGDIVDIIGTSKGKGYSGVIKRYHHKIGYKSHGSGYHRGLGSFANNGRCNNRVLPGKKMSGHHGFKQATILNLSILEVNTDKQYILVKGAIPGSEKSLIKIRNAIKFKNLSAKH